MSNVKITIEISDDENKQREQFIAFAKFAKSYRSSKKVEKAWEQWVKKTDTNIGISDYEKSIYIFNMRNV